jgi:hypothetical protein
MRVPIELPLILALSRRGEKEIVVEVQKKLKSDASCGPDQNHGNGGAA